MKKLYDLLMMPVKGSSYTLLFISALVLVISILLRHPGTSITEGLIEIISPILLLFALTGLSSWFRKIKYRHYAKRIRREYRHKLHRQAYKLKRLTHLEQAILFGLIKENTYQQISAEHQLPTDEIFRHVDTLVVKLNIHKKGSLLDIDWKNAVGQ